MQEVAGESTFYSSDFYYGGAVMADTKIQREVEEWIRVNWMEKHFGQEFRRDKVKLSPGGTHEFSAVSDDDSIVACITTSQAKSPSTSRGTGKINKIRSDLYFLLLVEAKRKLVLFTEPDMYEVFLKEAGSGRVPISIEFRLVIPEDDDLVERLCKARKTASDEVNPNR